MRTPSLRSTATLAVIISIPFATTLGSEPTARRAPASVAVTASVETEPVPNPRDAADDPLIFIHPTDPALSLVMGNDKRGAYEVYDLRGKRLQSLSVDVANTDLRYNFPLGGERVALVVGYSRTRQGMIAWKVNPATRQLEEVTAPGAPLRGPGGTLYYSVNRREYFWFTNHNGTLYQYRIIDDGRGRVSSALVRTYAYGSGAAEGVVADDVLGFVYVAEETVGLWKIPAEPDAKNEKILVDRPIEQGGHFEPDLEGLTIYYKPDGTGYLFASSQGNNSYNLYTREAPNRYLGTFTIADGTVDGTSSTDGIDVTNLPLGPDFPHGLFVVQDGQNMNEGVRVNQNFKLVPFERIAAPFGLKMDTRWDPRKVGR